MSDAAPQCSNSPKLLRILIYLLTCTSLLKASGRENSDGDVEDGGRAVGLLTSYGSRISTVRWSGLRRLSPPAAAGFGGETADQRGVWVLCSQERPVCLLFAPARPRSRQ